MSKSKSKRARAVAPYVQRALEDEYAQEQVRKAVARLRDVYGRLSTQRAAATEDKGLYRSLKEAAVSIRKAAGRIEEPPPPGHTLRNALFISFAAGGALILLTRSRKGQAPLPAKSAQHATDFSEPAPEPAPA
jgi:hypothetical protein